MCLAMCHDRQMQAYRDDRGNNILHLAAVHGATFIMRTPTSGCARVSDRVLTESKGCNSWNCFNKTMEHWKIICKHDGLEPSVTTTYLVGKCLHFEYLRRKSERQTRDHYDAFGRVRRLPQTFSKARDHLTSGLRFPGSVCPGFGINPRDSKGWTPIAIAAFHGHKKICQAWNRLLKHAESIFCLQNNRQSLENFADRC